MSLLNATGATEIVNFSQGQLSLILIKIRANSPYANKTIAEINAINPELIFRCVAVLRSDKTIMPKDSDIILPHDLVYMVVKIKEIDKAIEDAGIKKFSVKNVMIIGGGRIGVKTAQRIENKINVKLFEIDKQRARRLANTLENTLVVNADCRDIDSLEEEEIGQMDAFVALTNYSETNIIACLIAKIYGIKRVIALVDNVEFIGIAQNVDIDTTINRKLITASHIAKYTMEAKAASVTYLQGIDADVMELVAMSNSKATKKPIRHIGLPEGEIIGGIVSNKIGHIATGDFQIEPYDNVIVFALPSAFIKVQTCLANTAMSKQALIKVSLVGKYLGMALIVSSVMMLFSACIALLHKEQEYLMFVYSFAITFIIGFVLVFSITINLVILFQFVKVSP